jgi:hypothetical protein|uniref:Uncharacterized protein n=1 Tax=Desulfobacca acetoxidans TaxID=60893 RepID=A0A7V6A203_9BACT
MSRKGNFFAEAKINGIPLRKYLKGEVVIDDRSVLKDFLEYVHMKKGLLEAYSPSYPLVEARELLPSFEKSFSEHPELPSFSLVALNRPLSYQEEAFQFDLLHPARDDKKILRESLEKISPHLDKERRTQFRNRLGQRDLTDLGVYEEMQEFLFHMDRAQVIARDEEGMFRLLGVYASFPSNLDDEIKTLGRQMGRFKKLDNAVYERERYFVYQFLMELYGFPIASERRTSAALFARKLSRAKEQYLIKVLGNSDRTITSLCGFEQKKYPLVEKVALVSLPAAFTETHSYLTDQGFFLDPGRRVVLFKATYKQHKYNPLNVLEDRALSVVSQEIIHPVHGGRDTGFNLLKDTLRSLKDLTDIVRGEYLGSISYRRQELIAAPKTHEDRLKFLSAWLTKNQRRLATYSPENFQAARKVLNSYLINKDYKEVFSKYPDLHREALRQVAILSQAHQLQTLEKLTQKHADRRRLGPYQRISQAVSFLEENREELLYFYPDMFQKLLDLWKKLMDYPYFRHLQKDTSPPALPFRRRVWQILMLGERLVQELIKQNSQIQEEVRRGVPFPMVAASAPSGEARGEEG